MKIDQYIHDLLEKEGQVKLPSLGTIYRAEKSASFDKSGKNLVPPSRETGFKQDLKMKDDQLSKFISSKEGISQAESTKLIEEYVDEARNKLKTRKKFTIENVGLLYISSRRLQFKAAGETEALKDHPLPKVPVTPVTKTGGDDDRKSGKKARKVRKDGVSRWDVLIPLILLLIMVGILIYITINPQKIGIFNYAYSGWVPLHKYSSEVAPDEGEPPVIKPQKATESQEQDKTPEPQAATETTTQEIEKPVAGKEEQKPEKEKVKPAVPDKKEVKEKPAAPAPEPAKETRTAARTGKYHIIISSLEYRTMAEVHAEKLKKKGYNAVVLGPFPNGNFRVSIESYKDKNKAMDRLETIRQEVSPGAWLLKY